MTTLRSRHLFTSFVASSAIDVRAALSRATCETSKTLFTRLAVTTDVRIVTAVTGSYGQRWSMVHE